MTPDALLFITPGCPHCPVVLEGLAALVKEGRVGRLEVVNVAVHPELAAEHGVRSAPWTRLGPLEFEGSLSPQELRTWTERLARGDAVAEYAREQLTAGRLDKVERLVGTDPGQLPGLLPLVGDSDTSMQVRLGVGAVLEALEGSAPLQELVPALIALSTHADHRVRSDACHYLGLSHAPAARPALEARLEDERSEVREIAREALEGLEL